MSDQGSTESPEQTVVATLAWRAAQLERALSEAYEALAWHDGLNFEPNDRNGKTIGQIISDEMGFDHED
jgi:hypothetical protein